MAITEFDFTQIFIDERLGFLSTISKDSAEIQQNVVSWIYGYKPDTLRIAVSSKSDIVSNLESNSNANFAFFYNHSIASFRSKANIVTKKMPGIPMPLTLIELQTNELHDIMFYGAEISQEPVYRKTYNAEAAKKLDKQVYESMALSTEEISGI
jgi:hypothetical protein